MVLLLAVSFASASEENTINDSNLTSSDIMETFIESGNNVDILSDSAGSFSDLNTDLASGDTITLNRDYTFNPSTDSDFIDGIKITRDNLVINGNGKTIDAGGKARIFKSSSRNIMIKNI